MANQRTTEQPPDQDWPQHDLHDKGEHQEQKKEEHIEERTAPAGEIVYHAVYREGERS